MKEWLICATYSVGVMGMFSFGLLMLLAPGKSIKLRDWMMRTDRWSRPNPEWKPSYLLDSRVAGLVLCVIASLMMRPLLRAFWNLPRGGRPEPSHPATSTTDLGADWFTLGVGLVMILGGIHTLIRPETLLRWAASRLPHRIFAEDAVSKGRPAGRVLGALAVLAGTFAIYAWLKTIR